MIDRRLERKHLEIWSAYRTSGTLEEMLFENREKKALEKGARARGNRWHQILLGCKITMVVR